MSQKAAVIGGGIAGLAAAIRLQCKGYQVTIFEANDFVGGKLSEFWLGDYRFDAGPSLFTLPEQVTELFELAGKKPEDYFQYDRLPLVTRYFYEDGTTINAWGGREKLANEIEKKTGEKAISILRFLAKSRELYEITEGVFLRQSLHKLGTYLQRDTLRSMMKLHRLDAFRTMHEANRQWFSDERVTQLFDRFATYNGSDPYQAPATLNIIPYLEHELGAFFPKGGMYQIVRSLARLAKEIGVEIRLKQKVEQIIYQRKRVTAVRVNGENIAASIVVSNMDVVQTYRRLLPDFSAPERTLNQAKSSSALIFYWGMDRMFPELSLHNIFFSQNYQLEFQQLFREEGQGIYFDPTVYVYISAKEDKGDAPEGCENWFVMINVPNDQGQDWDTSIENARQSILDKLSRQLKTVISAHIRSEKVMSPKDIAQRTSSTQGALYGNSSNNRFAAFLRHPNFSSKLKGLYFCGGSVHPGGGIPLCLLSAKIVGDLIPTHPKR